MSSGWEDRVRQRLDRADACLAWEHPNAGAPEPLWPPVPGILASLAHSAAALVELATVALEQVLDEAAR